MIQCRFGGVANQTARIIHFIHDFITSINTGGTTDTFILQTVADIDTNRANLYTLGTVDTVAHIGQLCFGHVFLARTARFAALGVVRNNQSIFIKHRTLEAGIRAHIFAHLLAHDVRHQPSHKAIKGCGKQRGTAGIKVENIRHQLADGRKPTGKSNAGPRANGKNQQIFGELDADFAGIPWFFIQFQPFVAVAFY